MVTGLRISLNRSSSSTLTWIYPRSPWTIPLPSTLVGDTIFEETNESTQSKQDPKDDSVVLAQHVADPFVTPLISSIDLLNVENPLAQDVQDLSLKNDENPQDAPAFLTYLFYFLNDNFIVYLV